MAEGKGLVRLLKDFVSPPPKVPTPQDEEKHRQISELPGAVVENGALRVYPPQKPNEKRPVLKPLAAKEREALNERLRKTYISPESMLTSTERLGQNTPRKAPPMTPEEITRLDKAFRELSNRDRERLEKLVPPEERVAAQTAGTAEAFEHWNTFLTEHPGNVLEEHGGKRMEQLAGSYKKLTGEDLREKQRDSKNPSNSIQ